MESVFDYSSFFDFPGCSAYFINDHSTTFEDRSALVNFVGLSPNKIVIPNQVHSANIAVVHDHALPIDTDGIVTTKPGLVLTIQVADCIPVYFADPKKRIIGLVHAGWRGISKGILLEAVNQFKALGSRISPVKVLFGPSIRQCCFEVKNDVLHHFPVACIHNDNRNRYWIDLQLYATQQLVKSGIHISNISNDSQCTCHNNEYQSYRRDGEKAGRMIAVMSFS